MCDDEDRPPESALGKTLASRVGALDDLLVGFPALRTLAAFQIARPAHVDFGPSKAFPLTHVALLPQWIHLRGWEVLKERDLARGVRGPEER